MPGPNIDLEKPNIVGALDRLTTNVAMSLIGVISTFFTCIATPWRVVPLIEGDEPDGRIGTMLSPGAFLPLSVMVSLIGAALFTTPEILNSNGAYLGPGLALSVQSAVTEGDIWKTIAVVMPIYGVTILVGSLGLMLKPLTNQTWTLRVSMRAVFYVVAVAVSLIILMSAAIDSFRVTTGNNEFGWFLYDISPIPVVSLMLWMYFWFFRAVGSLSLARSSVLSVLMVLIEFAAVLSLERIFST